MSQSHMHTSVSYTGYIIGYLYNMYTIHGILYTYINKIVIGSAPPQYTRATYPYVYIYHIVIAHEHCEPDRRRFIVPSRDDLFKSRVYTCRTHCV